MYELICPRCSEPRYGENRQEVAVKMQAHLSGQHAMSPSLRHLQDWAKELSLLPHEVEAARAREESAARVAVPPAPGAVQAMLGI